MSAVAAAAVLAPVVHFASDNLIAVITGLIAAAISAAVLWKSRIRRRKELADKRLRAALPFRSTNDKQVEHATGLAVPRYRLLPCGGLRWLG